MDNKWQGLTIEEVREKINAASEHAAAGKYYVRVAERREMGACGDEYRDTLVFDSEGDFLDYLKNAWLPRVAAEKGGLQEEGKIKSLADYFENPDITLGPEAASGIKELDESIGKEPVGSIIEKFNSIFRPGHPYFWIITAGSLEQVVRYMGETDDFGEKREEEDEYDAVKLAAAGKFDENNPEHIEMAKEFFERSMYA